MSLKETIEKLSEYNKDLRNDYGAIPVLVQQQNTETTNLDAFKANKIRPTKDGLKDSKRSGEDRLNNLFIRIKSINYTVLVKFRESGKVIVIK